MLIGEFHHNLDEKNRLMIPAKTLRELEDEVIITRGFEKCLLVYPVKKWETVINKFEELSITKSDTRKFMRILLSGATSCKFDAHARICIPGVLKSYAGLKKEAVILGLDDHLEIWNESDYAKFLEDNLDDFAKVAEGLFE